MIHAKVDTTLNVYTQAIGRVAVQGCGRGSELIAIVHKPEGVAAFCRLKQQLRGRPQQRRRCSSG
jgi:hypothetical protein